MEFAIHDVRGIKGYTRHDPRSGISAREAALESALHIFRREDLVSQNWVIDIALEIMQDGRLLQWITPGNSRILRYLLPPHESEKEAAHNHSGNQYVAEQQGSIQARAICTIVTSGWFPCRARPPKRLWNGIRRCVHNRQGSSVSAAPWPLQAAKGLGLALVS